MIVFCSAHRLTSKARTTLSSRCSQLNISLCRAVTRVDMHCLQFASGLQWSISDVLQLLFLSFELFFPMVQPYEVSFIELSFDTMVIVLFFVFLLALLELLPNHFMHLVNVLELIINLDQKDFEINNPSIFCMVICWQNYVLLG